MKILIIAVSVVVVLLCAVSLQMFIKNRQTPKGLGVTDGRLAPVPASPNAVASQTDVKDKQVAPFPFKGDLETSRKAIKKVLRQYGNVEIITETDRYIHAVAKTDWMKFRDDLEFYFDETEKVIHFRSASRVGYSDMGLNRKRYKELMKLYEEE